MDKNMRRVLSKKNSEAGFALIAAIMACLILLALGMLVISLSTQDIRVSTKIVGEKRALAAAETGINTLLLQTADPRTVPAPVTTNRADGVSSFTINYPAKRPPVPIPPAVAIPPTRPCAGTSGCVWNVSYIEVVGKNTEYNTQVTIGAWMGWYNYAGTDAPDASTMQR